MKIIAKLIIALSISLSANTFSQPIRIAVATNFKTTLEKIVANFRVAHPAEITISAGATGQLFAQINNGAPFDIFLAADEQTCDKLVALKLVKKEDVFVYSIGRLVVYSAKKLSEKDIEKKIGSSSFKHIAIANPEIAPYGKAAVEALKSIGTYDAASKKIVWAENVGQSWQFAVSGAADFSFVSLAQVLADGIAGSHWIVPEKHYQAIRQSAGLLTKSREKGEVQSFWKYLRSEDVRTTIIQAGYHVDKK